MRLYDCFCYNGEPIIQLRLELMYPVVDRIFITESWYTFTGLRKPALFKDTNSELFRNYADKITWIVLDNIVHSNPWINESAQRNAAASHLGKGPYIVLVCDVDEIVNPAVVKNISGMYGQFTKPIALEMEFFYYSFQWRKKFAWRHPFVVNDRGIALSSDLDSMRLSGKVGYVRNAGWHCSFFESVENIVRKVESFSHQEHNNARIKTPEHILGCIESGGDLFARGEDEDLERVDLSTLPAILGQWPYRATSF